MITYPRIYDYTMISRIGARPITAMDVANELKLYPDDVTGEHKVYIESLIDAAIFFAEKCTKRIMYNSAFTAYLDAFYSGDSYEIRLSPLNTIESIYYTSNGSQVELSTDNYYAALSPTFSYLGLKTGKNWPTVDNLIHSVSINVTAGYTSLPADLKKAILQYIGMLYSNRGDCDTGSTSRYGNDNSCSLPASVKNIFNMYRIVDLKIGM